MLCKARYSIQKLTVGLNCTGSNFEGSKSATAVLAKVTDGKAVSLTKTSRRILASQKESPCPVLFMGNLGYEAIKEQIREMLLHHVQVKGKKATDPKTSKPPAPTIAIQEDDASEENSQAEGDDSSPSTAKNPKPASVPLLSFETTAATTSEPSSKPRKLREPKKAEDKVLSAASELGLRKIRLFTFPDTGKCKGYVELWIFSLSILTLPNLIKTGSASSTSNRRHMPLPLSSIQATTTGTTGTSFYNTPLSTR